MTISGNRVQSFPLTRSLLLLCIQILFKGTKAETTCQRCECECRRSISDRAAGCDHCSHLKAAEGKSKGEVILRYFVFTQTFCSRLIISDWRHIYLIEKLYSYYWRQQVSMNAVIDFIIGTYLFFICSWIFSYLLPEIGAARRWEPGEQSGSYLRKLLGHLSSFVLLFFRPALLWHLPAYQMCFCLHLYSLSYLLILHRIKNSC